MMVPAWCDTERTVEVPWLLGALPKDRNLDLLDVGGVSSFYHRALLDMGHALTVIDLRSGPFEIGTVFWQGSAVTMPAEWTTRFACVLCISTLDHIGLPGFDSETEDWTALIRAVGEMARVCKPNGMLYMTAPVGVAQITSFPDGLQRVFDVQALLALFSDAVWDLHEWRVWRLNRETGRYLPRETVDAVADAGYLGYRAEAVMALALRKR